MFMHIIYIDIALIHNIVIKIVILGTTDNTYYAQYYTQEQELWSDYYVIHILVCMNNSLQKADSFKKTV